MAQCYLTGVEIQLEDAYILDLTTAHRTLRELKQKVATLERLIAQLGATDVVPVPNRAEAGTFLRKDRRLVSRAVALALGAVCPDRQLFLPWILWRARGRAWLLSALRQHPDYAGRFRELSAAEAEQVLTLAHQVLQRLARGEHLPPEVRMATMAGVCVTLRDRSPEEVIAILQDRLASNAPLEDLGVPAGVEPQFRAALGPRPPEPWGAPPLVPASEPSELGDPGQPRDGK